MPTACRGMYVGWGYPLAWGQALADDLGAKTFFARSFDGPKRGLPAVVRYLEYLSRTKREMEAFNPTFVIWQIPPSIGPLSFYAAWPRYNRVPWLLDLHSGAVNVRRWRWMLPLLRNRSTGAELVIVHNEEVAAELKRWPCPIAVLDTYVVPPGEDPGTRAHAEDGPIVVTASGMADEPLAAVASAASQLVPARRFVITGRREAVIKRLSGLDLPPSVELSGYLPRVDYLRLLATASLVVCLTTRPATMQLGAWEAISLECPVIVSDHSVLRTYYGDVAYYTKHSGSQLAHAVQQVLDNYRIHVSRTRSFAAQMRLRRAQQIQRIKDALRHSQ